MQPKRRKRPAKRTPSDDSPRPAPTNNSFGWYIVAFVVVLGVLALVMTGETRYKVNIGNLRELVEQGQKPEASILITEEGKDSTRKVRYSDLAHVRVGPHEITGTVTRQVLGLEGKAGEPKKDVPFYSPRLGLEDTNNAFFDLLYKNGFRDVSADSSPSSWQHYVTMIVLMASFLIILAFMLHRLGGTGAAMAFGRSRGKLLAQEGIGVTFEDVAGVDEAVEELREVVDFLRQPDKYQVLGARIPKGVLLVGPPGTGKTLLGKAIAGEAGVPFFSMSGSDFVEMYVGVGAARVRDMFEQAVSRAPCIVFIDELDALGKTRGSNADGRHDEREQTLNALLVEMDGFGSNSGVIVMAATNRPETLDPALLRPGRFDRHVLVDRPDVRGREAILRVHAQKIKLDKSVELQEIARITSGFVGADLANLVNEAALLAARAGKKTVGAQELNEGVERITAGLEKRQRIMHADEKQRVAYHESAHALVAFSLPNTDPVHKVSIIPRGLAALGYTMHRPEGDRYLMTQSELESRILVFLAGTLAEEMVFGDVSTGAQNDLERATEIARSMVMDYGMSRLGRVTYRESRRSLLVAGGQSFSGERAHSEQTAREIDEEMKRFITEGQAKVRQILESRRKALVALADRLIEKETIDNGELREVIEANSSSPMIVPGTGDAAPHRRLEEPTVREIDRDGQAEAGA